MIRAPASSPDFAWSWYGYPADLCRDGQTRAGIDDDLAGALGLPLVSSRVVAEGGGLGGMHCITQQQPSTR